MLVLQSKLHHRGNKSDGCILGDKLVRRQPRVETGLHTGCDAHWWHQWRFQTWSLRIPRLRTAVERFFAVRLSYCDEYVCLSVCLSDCSHNSKTTRSNYTEFFVHVAHSSVSVLGWPCCDTFRTSGFADEVVFYVTALHVERHVYS